VTQLAENVDAAIFGSCNQFVLDLSCFVWGTLLLVL